MARCFSGRAIGPSLIVGTGILPCRMTVKHKAVACQLSTEGQFRQRIIHLLFHRLHFLLLHRSIEDGHITVMMEEYQLVRSLQNTVAPCDKRFRSSKFIGSLETTTLAKQPVMGSPRLIRYLCLTVALLVGHLHMYHGFLHIRPYQYGLTTVGHFTIAFLQHQPLTEGSSIEWSREMNAEASELQQTIVFIETAAAREVEEHITLFHPDVHAHITSATRHRLRGIAAWRSPFVGSGLGLYFRHDNHHGKYRQQRLSDVHDHSVCLPKWQSGFSSLYHLEYST